MLEKHSTNSKFASLEYYMDEEGLLQGQFTQSTKEEGLSAKGIYKDSIRIGLWYFNFSHTVYKYFI